MVMSRHEFLTALHELLKPTTYLETGVQAGVSLALSKAPISVGIDPHPLQAAWDMADHDHVIYDMTSDAFFEHIERVNDKPVIDLAFIDGMHLAEFAWRDFRNIVKYSHAGTVIVFDDVLPYTTDMAAREICPGDWTGDVWKIFYHLRSSPDLVLQLVDTSPTGTLVVTGFDRVPSFVSGEEFEHWLRPDLKLEDGVLDRRHAWKAEHVLENLRSRGFAK